MQWGYPHDESGKNKGRLCWYCHRLYYGWYVTVVKWKDYTLAQFFKLKGTEADLSNEWQATWDKLIKQCEEKGVTMGMFFNWQQMHAEVVMFETNEIIEDDPEVTMMPKTAYVVKHGDPAANGHKESMYRGVLCVEIPGEQVWKVRKRARKGVEKREVQRSSDDALLPDELDNLFGGLSHDLFASLPDATGMSLSALAERAPNRFLGNGAPSGAGGSDKPRPAAPAGADDDEDGQLGGSIRKRFRSAIQRTAPENPQAGAAAGSEAAEPAEAEGQGKQ